MVKSSPKKAPKKVSKKLTESKAVSTTVKLPGYWRFSRDVLDHLMENRATFGKLLLLAVAALLLIAGLNIYDSYSGLSQNTEEVSAQLSGGVLKTLVEVVALYLSILTGSLVSSITESQQLFLGLTYLLLWLVTVWLIRHQLSQARVILRDGLYNASSPLLSTVIILMFAVLQLLPFGLLVSLLAALNSIGIMTGIWGVLGVAIAITVFVATLYWLVGTLFALNVVTIPGAYPRAALRSAKELIAGYRKTVLLRLLWLGFVLFFASFLLLPVILFDALLGYALAFPVMVVVVLGMIASFIYAAAYNYLLYRKIIDERAD